MKINLIRKEEQEQLDKLKLINFYCKVETLKFQFRIAEKHASELQVRFVGGYTAGLKLRDTILKLKSQGLA